VIFFGALAAMFAISMKGMFWVLDDKRPRYTLDDSIIGSNPGISVLLLLGAWTFSILNILSIPSGYFPYFSKEGWAYGVCLPSIRVSFPLITFEPTDRFSSNLVWTCATSGHLIFAFF
jgi:hypothetical protein